MGNKAFLLPFLAFALEWSVALMDKRAVAQRLCGLLQLDIDKTRQLLGWIPPLSLDEGLRRAAERYRR